MGKAQVKAPLPLSFYLRVSTASAVCPFGVPVRARCGSASLQSAKCVCGPVA